MYLGLDACMIYDGNDIDNDYDYYHDDSVAHLVKFTQQFTLL